METNNKISIKRLIILIIILLAFIGFILSLYFGLGINARLNNKESIKEIIDSYGNKGKIIYILINFLQTTIIPITNIPTIIAGKYLFGPFSAATYATIGLLLGSIVSFYFGRVLGKKAIEWIVGKENLEKYLKMAKGRENLVIFLILLLPGFPDDIICLIAGVTSMSWPFFLISILITRTIPVYLTAYATDFLPINKLWGLAIWALIYIVVIIMGRYVLKYWDNITKFFEKFKFKKRKDI